MCEAAAKVKEPAARQRWAQFFHNEALILGKNQNNKPLLLLMKCLKLSASDSAQLKHEASDHGME